MVRYLYTKPENIILLMCLSTPFKSLPMSMSKICHKRANHHSMHIWSATDHLYIILPTPLAYEIVSISLPLSSELGA